MLFCNGILFGEVNVIINVILTEAVIALAARTVTELKIGVIGIGTSANGALTGVALVLSFRVSLLGGFLEVDHVRVSLVFYLAAQTIKSVEKHISAEDEVIQDSNDGNKSHKDFTGGKIQNNTEEEVGGINISQPLYFYGDKEEKQYAAFGEEGSKNEEHGEIDVGCSHGEVTDISEKPDYHAVNYCAEDTAEIIQRELRSTPLTLKRVANEIIEVQRNCHGDKTAAFGDKYERNKSPHLTFEYELGVEQQVRQKISGSVHHGE